MNWGGNQGDGIVHKLKQNSNNKREEIQNTLKFLTKQLFESLGIFGESPQVSANYF